MKASLPNWLLVHNLEFSCFFVRPLEVQCGPFSTHEEIHKFLFSGTRVLTIIILQEFVFIAEV